MFTFFVRHEWWFAAVQLGLAMFGMGATLRVADFLDVFRRPRAFALGTAVQIIGLPLVAIAVAALLGPPPGIAFGLLLLAAMPPGAMSGVITYFAKGTVPLSITLTATGTLACMLTTPIVLRLFGGELVRGDFVMPTHAIALDIAVCLLGPLIAGMAFGAARPALRSPVARWSIRASLVVVLAIAIGSAGAGRLDAGAQGSAALTAALVFAFAVQQTGALAAWVGGLPRPDAAAIAIETAIRNTNLALLLKATLFPAVPGVVDPVADSVLFVALLYAGVAGPLVIPLLLVHRWLARGEAAAAA